MPSIKANHITLEYETFGRKEDPTILLIMGLSMQMIAWPEALCESLAAQGFQVIRFDNRDVGLSEKFHGAKAPSPLKILLHRALKSRAKVPYTLHDMASDSVGLLDALEIQSAHVVGASMGGMIAQLLAAQHSQRITSLTSIMSTSGKLRYSIPQVRVLRQMLLNRPKTSQEKDIVQYARKLWAMIGSPDYPMPDELLRERVLRAYRRCHYPQGFLRHIAAIVENGDRSHWLQQIKAPTLVIHGSSDPMVHLGGGRDTAAKIPGARFELIQGMGHNLPPGLVPHLSTLIGQHAKDAENRKLPPPNRSVF